MQTTLLKETTNHHPKMKQHSYPNLGNFSNCFRFTHTEPQKDLTKLKKVFGVSFHLCNVRKIKTVKP